MRLVSAICFAFAASVSAGEIKLTLRNPGMEAAISGVPAGWHGRFGRVTVTRDTEVFHSGAASLSVQNSGPRNGCAHQMLRVTPGLKLKLGGWLRSSEGAKVNLAAQFFDEKFTWDEFIQVRFLEGAHDWHSVEKELTVPDKAVHMAIALYVDGVGRAWLDDVTLSADGAQVDVVTPDPAAAPPREPADPALVPATPVPGFYPDYPEAWRLLHENHVRRAQQGGIDVLFIGDSLTQGWMQAGKDAWEKHFAPLRAACFGIGGDKTGNVLWRLDHGEVDGLTPRLVVLLIGLNNLWSGHNDGEEIAGGIRAIIVKLRTRLPRSKVLVLGVLPIGLQSSDYGRLRVQDVNEHAAKLDDGAMVRFADPRLRLLSRDGGLLDGAYQKDHVHLTSKGYAVLAEALTPLVADMLK